MKKRTIGVTSKGVAKGRGSAEGNKMEHGLSEAKIWNSILKQKKLGKSSSSQLFA